MTQTFPSFNTNETTSKNRQRRKKAQHNSPPSFTTTAEVLAWAQQHTGTHYFPGLEPSDEPKPTLEGLLKSHRDTVDQLSVRFPAYGDDLTKVKAEPVRWLWQNRIPLAGITLLDGDHGTGKSLLALQIAGGDVAQHLRQHRLGIRPQALTGFRRDEVEYAIYGTAQIHASFFPSSCLLVVKRADSGTFRRAPLSSARPIGARARHALSRATSGEAALYCLGCPAQRLRCETLFHSRYGHDGYGQAV